jgi:2-oxoglutarate dehydrogenase E2 component (dihydrolipoamide succinyltransferase)
MLRQFIARFRNAAVVSVAAATLGITSLAACGVKGPLKLPPPSPAAPASPTTTGTDATGSAVEAPPAATTEPPAPSAPKTPETKP